MKPIRLLPVVIFAALALLVFKGIGLVTNGGYVLTGTTAVLAEGATPPPADAAAPADGATAPSDPTMTDANAVLADTAPTIATKPEAAPAGEHAAPAGDHTASGTDSSSASGEAALSSSAEAPAHGASSEALAAAVTCAPAAPAASGEAAPAAAAPAHGADATAGAATATDCAASSAPVDANGDAIPSTKDGNGNIVPLSASSPDNSKELLLQRLGARSAELDKRQADLEMQASLLAAAQKKLDDQTKALADLQAQVAAAVDQKKAAEDQNFKGIVSMYESMKPADAARIFDTLDLNVLIKVAQAMNPKKMAPVLAAMAPQPAQALTTAFATSTPTPPAAGSENLAALPQIVGK